METHLNSFFTSIIIKNGTAKKQCLWDGVVQHIHIPGEERCSQKIDNVDFTPKIPTRSRTIAHLIKPTLSTLYREFFST